MTVTATATEREISRQRVAMTVLEFTLPVGARRFADTSDGYKALCDKCDGTGHLPEYAGLHQGVCYPCNGLGLRGAFYSTRAALDAAMGRLAAEQEAQQRADAKRAAEYAAKRAAELEAWQARNAELLAWCRSLTPDSVDEYTDSNVEWTETREEAEALAGPGEHIIKIVPMDNGQWWVNVGRHIREERFGSYGAKVARPLAEVRDGKALDAKETALLTAVMRRTLAAQASARYAGELDEKVTVTGVVTYADWKAGDSYGGRSTSKLFMIIEGAGPDAGITVKVSTAAKSARDLKAGDAVTVTGTVREHKERAGIPQTVLFRPTFKTLAPAAPVAVEEPQEAPAAPAVAEETPEPAQPVQQAPSAPKEPVMIDDLTADEADALYAARYERLGRFETQDDVYAAAPVREALLAKGLAALDGTSVTLTKQGRALAREIEARRAQERERLAEELAEVQDRDRAAGVISDEQLDLWEAGRAGWGYRNSVEALRPVDPAMRPAVMREARVFMNTTPGWNLSGAVWEAARNVPKGRTPGGDRADMLMAYDPDGTKAAASAARGGTWTDFTNAAERAQEAAPAPVAAGEAPVVEEAPGEAQGAPVGALPETVEATALNGHRMTYRVTGVDQATGALRTSQWDAEHADSCPCRTSGEYEPLPDY